MFSKYALQAISCKVKCLASLYTRTRTVGYYIRNSTHSERFIGVQGSHLLLLVFLFYLKRDTPSHHIFNFGFNSLLMYQTHQWGISASHSAWRL